MLQEGRCLHTASPVPGRTYDLGKIMHKVFRICSREKGFLQDKDAGFLIDGKRGSASISPQVVSCEQAVELFRIGIIGLPDKNAQHEGGTPGFFIVVVKKNGFHVIINIKNDSALVIKQERSAFQSVGKGMEKSRFFLVFPRFNTFSLWYSLSMLQNI